MGAGDAGPSGVARCHYRGGLDRRVCERFVRFDAGAGIVVGILFVLAALVVVGQDAVCLLHSSRALLLLGGGQRERAALCQVCRSESM